MALLPSASLPSLPHVRRLTVQSYVRTAISLSLPMPRLNSFQVFNWEEELGPISADLVAISRPPSKRGGPPAPPPFPALTRLQLDAVRIKLDCSAMPALAEARLTLVFPEAQFKVDNPSALTALTSLVRMGVLGVAWEWHGNGMGTAQEWQGSRQGATAARWFAAAHYRWKAVTGLTNNPAVDPQQSHPPWDSCCVSYLVPPSPRIGWAILQAIPPEGSQSHPVLLVPDGHMRTKCSSGSIHVAVCGVHVTNCTHSLVQNVYALGRRGVADGFGAATSFGVATDWARKRVPVRSRAQRKAGQPLGGASACRR